MTIPTPPNTVSNSFIGAISLKTVILIIVGIVLIYGGIKVATGTPISNLFSGGVTSNKIICKPNQAVVNGACIDVGPCGLLPTTNSNCNISALICDPDIGNKWRCPLPCEKASNPVPNGIGKCTKQEVKCDSLGAYYCPNDSTFCSSCGSYYLNDNGVNGSCLCNLGYIGDKCQTACPPNHFGYQNQTCMPILTCDNGTFSMIDNKCICNTGYYNYNNQCLLIPNCTNGSNFNISSRTCICSPQHYGTTCQNDCGSGKYYYNGNCTNILSCNNGGFFNMTTNSCSCAGNYTGLTCDYNSTITCNGNGTVVLNQSKLFDKCNCTTGFFGVHCNVSAGYCNNRGTPIFDANGNVNGCSCNPLYGGKYCDLSGYDYCHGHGTPLSTGVDSNNRSIFDYIHGCTGCDSSSSGKYCCTLPLPTNTDACGTKGFVCNSTSSANRGWNPEYYTAADFSNNQDFKNGKGPCVSQYCGIVDTTKYKVVLESRGTGVAGENITCSVQCPYTLTNDMCPGGGSSSSGVYDANTCKVTYDKGDSYTHQCVCDATTGYSPSCQPVQTNALQKCGPVPVGLCGQGGPTPECLQCPHGGFMWYCPGEVPSKGTNLANNLMRCVGMSNNIVHNDEANFWQVLGTNRNTPIYPSINNDTCDSLSGSLSTNFVSSDTQDLYNIFGNTATNYTVGTDGRFRKIADRTGVNGAQGLSSTQMLTNAYRRNDGTIGYFPSLVNTYNRTVVQNPGCISTISSNPNADYCQNHGTYKQVCYKSDGKTLVDCVSPDAFYRLKEGTCTCEAGYVGNQCQYSASNCNNNVDSISSDSTSKNALNGAYGSLTCNCSLDTDGFRRIQGDRCQYTRANTCNNKGYTSSTGTCTHDRTYYSYAQNNNIYYVGANLQYNDNDTCKGLGIANSSGGCDNTGDCTITTDIASICLANSHMKNGLLYILNYLTALQQRVIIKASAVNYALNTYIYYQDPAKNTVKPEYFGTQMGLIDNMSGQIGSTVGKMGRMFRYNFGVITLGPEFNELYPPDTGNTISSVYDNLNNLSFYSLGPRITRLSHLHAGIIKFGSAMVWQYNSCEYDGSNNGSTLAFSPISPTGIINKDNYSNANDLFSAIRQATIDLINGAIFNKAIVKITVAGDDNVTAYHLYGTDLRDIRIAGRDGFPSNLPPPRGYGDLTYKFTLTPS